MIVLICCCCTDTYKRIKQQNSISRTVHYEINGDNDNGNSGNSCALPNDVNNEPIYEELGEKCTNIYVDQNALKQCKNKDSNLSTHLYDEPNRIAPPSAPPLYLYTYQDNNF